MPSRYFAIVPAAGHSIRMGEPKLLMPVGGQPMIAHTLRAWQRSQVDRIFVVVRPGDDALAAAVDASNQPDKGRVDVVVPAVAPPDMKASIQAALAHIEQNVSPLPADAILNAPADMPQLSAPIVNRLIQLYSIHGGGEILLPTLSSKRGHPALFPWPLAADVFALAANEGMNAIVDRCPSQAIPCEDLVAEGESPFTDLDTPDQYRRMTNDQ